MKRLVFGSGHEVAGVVYGTVVVMATLTASYATVKDPWKLFAIVLSTAFVLWVAHLYAHGLGESISEGRRLDRAELKSVARRELGIVLAAVGPGLALLLGAAHVLKPTTSVWLALGVGLAVLAIEGVRYARLERLRPTATVAVVGLNIALGLLVVALKIGIAH